MSEQAQSGHNEFEAMADRLFAANVDYDLRTAAEGGAFAGGLWAAIVDSGIPLLLASEAQGGIGGSVADAAAILRMAGQHAVPAPVLDAMLGNLVAARAGLGVSSAPAALAFLQPGELDDDSRRLRCEAVELPWPDAIERIVLIAPLIARTHGARVVLATVTAPAQVDAAEALRDLRGEARRFVPAASLSLGPAATIAQEDAFATLHRLAGVLRAAQMLGALEWCARRSVEYASERKQFGREIGRFQIVQQLLAEMASGVVAASAIVSAAIHAADNAGTGAAQQPMIAAARSRLGDAIDSAVAVSHQIHGAIGFSREYPLNFRTRRLMGWRDEFGSVTQWRKVLGDHLAGLGAEEVWPALTSFGVAAQG